MIANDRAIAGKTIPLTQGQFALVDDEDFVRFNHRKWHAMKGRSGEFYAVSHKPGSGKCGRNDLLHRAIMGVTDPKVKIDHHNHDTLDNRRNNLRACTNSQNIQNRKGSQVNSTSGIRGVSWRKDRMKWEAKIKILGVTK